MQSSLPIPDFASLIRATNKKENKNKGGGTPADATHQIRTIRVRRGPRGAAGVKPSHCVKANALMLRGFLDCCGARTRSQAPRFGAKSAKSTNHDSRVASTRMERRSHARGASFGGSPDPDL